MEKEIVATELIVELGVNIKKHKVRLLELMKAYDLAVLGRDVAGAHENEIRSKILSENEFFAGRECGRCRLKIGDRITDETYTLLMSEEDFDRYKNISLRYFVEEGITDKDGRYLTDWVSIKVNAMNALADYIIDNILPAELREHFDKFRRNVVQEERLIDITREAIKA